MKRLMNFVFYNNGFVILVLLVVLSSGSVLAANEDVRDGVISSEDQLIEVDNSYIRDVNLDNHDFRVKITKVEKDDENYYVSYQFNTIELVEGAWKKIVKEDILTVNIEQLGERDLGLYAAEEFEELVAYTKKFLLEVQVAEKEKGESDKTVARTYRGLVGRFLEPEEITFAGYDPVIEPPVIVVVEPEPEPEEREEVPLGDVILDDEEIPTEEDPEDEDNDPTATTTEPVATSTDTTAPSLTLIGEAVMEVPQGSSFTDPGVIAVDDVNGDVSSYVVVSGTVNTDAIGSYTLTYSVADAVGNISSLTREVSVVAPAEPDIPDVSEPATTTSSSTTGV